jgi:hypothetical protein
MEAGAVRFDHTFRFEYAVLSVCGNREGLRRLAALLLLCADGERYDPSFHIHLDCEPGPPREPFFTGNIDVTLRAPVYLDVLKDGSFREWNMNVDLRDATDGDDEPWRSRPDA